MSTTVQKSSKFSKSKIPLPTSLMKSSVRSIPNKNEEIRLKNLKLPTSKLLISSKIPKAREKVATNKECRVPDSSLVSNRLKDNPKIMTKISKVSKETNKNKLEKKDPFVPDLASKSNGLKINPQIKNKIPKVGVNENKKNIVKKNILVPASTSVSNKLKNVKIIDKMSKITEEMKENKKKLEQKDHSLPDSLLTSSKLPVAAKETNTNQVENIHKNKKNKEVLVPDFVALQKDIVFEINEFNRNRILSGREISPSILKMQGQFKLSNVLAERPSIFNSLVDPATEALEAVKLLSAKRKMKLAAQPKLSITTPSKGFSQFLAPELDARTEGLRMLEMYKAKKALKSSKKVNFNSKILEYTFKEENDAATLNIDLENRLTNISEENSPHSSTSKENSCEKQLNINVLQNNKENKVFHSGIETVKVIQEQNSKDLTILDKQPDDNVIASETKFSSEHFHEKNNNSSCYMSNFKVKISVNKELNSIKDLSINNSRNFLCGDKSVENLNALNICGQFSSDFSVSVSNKPNDRTTYSRVYTPRPMSFYSNSNITNSSSPEFPELGAHNPVSSNFAPIQTPLVMKSLAKHSDTSPYSESPELGSVRMKLNFIENPTPKIETSNKRLSLACNQILTVQKKLNELADQECYLSLKNEHFPVVGGRYLKNPVSAVLSEGDEMHFLPINS